MPWETLYADIKPAKEELLEPETSPEIFSITPSAPAEETEIKSAINEELIPMSQYKGMYILLPVKSGLMWIHQRRAHIRVLYDTYRRQLDERRGHVQRVLFPERIDLSVVEGQILENIMEQLAYLGFEISSLGGTSYAIQGVPAGVDGLNPAELLSDILHSAMETTYEVGEKLHDAIALAMAKKVAIVAGQVLTFEEMDTLINDLFRCNAHSRTPDGLPIMYVQSDAEIAKCFAK
jgi:DNA mismatch repair protein MutL